MAASLWRAGAHPLQVAIHHQAELRQAVAREVMRFQPDVAVVVLSRLGWLLPELDGLPVVLDLVDSLSLNMRNRGTRQRWMSWLWSWEGRRLESWDVGLAGRVAAATVVSDRDREALKQASSDLADRLHVVPFGIPLADPPPAPDDREPAILLSGNLGYFPTRDGALWFADRVWPRVRRDLPQARWILAGSRAPRSVRRLADRPGIELIVDPEDLRAVRRRASLAVAPMLAGSGTPIKVLEAMRDGLPVVATPEAASGLDDLSGGELAVAGDPEAFAASIIALHRDVETARRQTSAAWSWLSLRHDLARVADRFEALLESVAAG